MASFTIKSRLLNDEFCFTVNGNRGYVRCNGEQICHGGKFLGSTITGSEEDLPAIARRWYRAYVRQAKEIGEI